MHDIERKLWLMLISRGAEIDDPSTDNLYLKIEKALILWNKPVYEQSDDTIQEAKDLFRELNLL